MRRATPLLSLLLTAALLTGCSNDGSGTPTTTSAEAQESPEATDTAEAGREPLRILASNDDGIDHPGLDLMVRRLNELPDVEVTVVAPAENMSGSSDNTTPGGASFEPSETASGVAATAVDGFPADTVHIALDELDLEPHLVVSGINDAHNIGPISVISGTVGVARTAIRRGVPGVAVSAGLEFNEPEFEVGAQLVVEWIEEHRAALVAGAQPTDAALSFNIPTCDPGDMGALVEVPLATEFPEGANPFVSECDLANTDPADDYEALASGYPALTRVPAEL